MIIDYSAYNAWQQCPAYWYEKYINRRQPRPTRAQRDDALALGSLVHEGLRLWQQTHRIEIPASIITEVSPTRECFNLAQELVYGYAQHYPEERWPLILCEEPVQWSLGHFDSDGSRCGIYPRCLEPLHEELVGLAKIDSYFYVPQNTEIPSGMEGQSLLLTPGWWIHEYKTKRPDTSMGLYMQGWEMNMQASFQIIALSNHLARIGRYEGVQGCLVNVLEKPKRHQPKRKCQPCGQYYDFNTWLPVPDGTYACPACGNRQKLQPLRENVPQSPPNYYRIEVHRTLEELNWAREQMLTVGEQMICMARQGLRSQVWNTRSCVNEQWRRPCEYFGPHKNNADTTQLIEYIEVPDYRGLPSES